MSKTSTLRAKLAFTKSVKRIMLAAAAATVLGTASAETASAHIVYGGGVVISIGSICPPGTHLGYLGKHCWSNYHYRGPVIFNYGYPSIWHRRIIGY